MTTDTDAKRAREREAKLQVFAAKGNERPKSTNLDEVLGDVAEKPVPVKAEKPAVKPSPATKSEPVAKAAQPAKAAPWADGNPKMLKQYPTRLPEPLHMKLAWLAEHVPASSIQKIIVAGAEKEVERLLKEYYK